MQFLHIFRKLIIFFKNRVRYAISITSVTASFNSFDKIISELKLDNMLKIYLEGIIAITSIHLQR